MVLFTIDSKKKFILLRNFDIIAIGAKFRQAGSKAVQLHLPETDVCSSLFCMVLFPIDRVVYSIAKLIIAVGAKVRQTASKL